MEPNGSKSRTLQREIAQHQLHIAVMRREWDEVVKLYKEHPEVHAARINEMNDTALHSAITNGASEASVKELVDEIVKTDDGNSNETMMMEALRAGNKRQDTPLHCAASRGSPLTCHRIIRVDESLVRERNIDGETPLFLAALNGHKETFLYLYRVCRKMETQVLSTPLWKRYNGDNILHCTIHRKFFDLSFQIVNIYKDQNIGSCFNDEGHIPLNVLAAIPSAFKSGTRLSLWNKLLYNLIRVEKLKFEPPEESHVLDVENSDEQCQTQLIKDASFSSQGTCRKIKEMHVWGEQLMEELIKQDSWYRNKENALELQRIMKDKDDLTYVPYYHHMDREVQKGRIKRSTALLIAAKNGLIEMVDRILTDIPVSIYDQTATEMKNVVHVAVEERQSHVLKAVMKHPLWNVLREKVDANGNNALHLAAQLSKYTAWEIRGSAMQMQWEVNWFEYVKENMPPYFISQGNANGKTPAEIFADEHKHLVTECDKWAKDTSGSYIVVSTLVAGVTFSTCYQVPGGYDTTGNPNLEVHPQFKIFTASTLVSFCFSVTSLAAFLAIFGSRKERPKGYHRNLPLKLCLGLSSFYVSIVSMLVSFCAAYSFQLHQRKKYMPSPLYCLILIPLCFYTTTQVPLYWELLKASLRKLPKPRCEDDDDYVGA